MADLLDELGGRGFFEQRMWGAFKSLSLADETAPLEAEEHEHAGTTHP